jgi:hypothetical protein
VQSSRGNKPDGSDDYTARASSTEAARPVEVRITVRIGDTAWAFSVEAARPVEACGINGIGDTARVEARESDGDKARNGRGQKAGKAASPVCGDASEGNLRVLKSKILVTIR